MINFEVLFKVSYGLYIVSSGNRNSGNGFISNTVFQVTAMPPQFAATCSKDNFTCDMILKTNSFSVSVLQQDASSELIGRFGYKSGKEFNKLEGMNLKYGITGVPIVLNDSIALLECSVKQIIDVGSHIIFIGELIQSEILYDNKEPLTYIYYRNVKKGVAPKNSPTYIDKSIIEKQKSELTDDSESKIQDLKFYKCNVCGYIYDEEEGDTTDNIKGGTLFTELPDDWVCPVCGAGKEEFTII